MPSGRHSAEWLGAPERPLEPHWKVMGEEAGQRLICVSLPAAIGACTLADRRNNVHCLRYGPHISAINPRVRFVIRPHLTHHHTDTRTIFLQGSSVLPSQAQLRSPREHQHFFVGSLQPVDQKEEITKKARPKISSLKIFGRLNSCDVWSTRRLPAAVLKQMRTLDQQRGRYLPCSQDTSLPTNHLPRRLGNSGSHYALSTNVSLETRAL